MEATKYRNILDGKKYNSLFPEAMLNDETVKRGATVADTVKFIPKVVHDTLNHTRKLARLVDSGDMYSTCRNIWNFVYNHIRYHKDAEGFEQIRSPARAWHDRFKGVDCDCYTVFISSVLTNLKIPHILRITKYGGKNFQHIYPVVPYGNSQITIDCVVDKFNYEEPYTEKQDTKMDLQYLNGFDSMDDEFTEGATGFGRLFKKKNKTKTGDDGKKKGGKLKELLHKGLNIVNKANPATALLRNGVLAAMKLNMFKIAQRLKWAYLSESSARSKGVDMDKWNRLVKIREKMEKIFYDAGGKQENLKKAILNGKGNKNHEVNGLGYTPTEETFYMNTATPLRKVLGEEIWQDENVNGLEGLEGEAGIGALGEVATAAAIASATTVLAAIGGLLKSIGNIFPKKQKGTEDFENTETEDNTAIRQAASNPSTNLLLPAPGTKSVSVPETSADDVEIPATDTPATTTEKTSTADTTTQTDNSGNGDEAKTGFWDKNKKWLKPTLFGAGGLGLLYGAYRLFGGKKKTTSRSTGEEVSGLEGLKRKSSGKAQNKTQKKQNKPTSTAGKTKTSTKEKKASGKKKKAGKQNDKKKAVALL